MGDRPAFGRDVLAQAFGTIIGGGVLFLIGKVSGVLGGVDWGEVGRAAFYFAIVIVPVSVLIGVNEFRERRAKRDRADKVQKLIASMSEAEGIAINAYKDKARWNNLAPEERSKFESVIAAMFTREV